MKKFKSRQKTRTFCLINNILRRIKIRGRISDNKIILIDKLPGEFSVYTENVYLDSTLENYAFEKRAVFGNLKYE